MADSHSGRLRIRGDFNSMSVDQSACWNLRYHGRLLDGVADELKLTDGMKVIVFDSDAGLDDGDLPPGGEEFEFDAVLRFRPDDRMESRWEAVIDQRTHRIVKSRPID